MRPFIAGLLVAIGQGVAAVADGRAIDVAIVAGIFFFGLTWGIASLMRLAIRYGSAAPSLDHWDFPRWRGTSDTPVRDR